MSTTFIRSPYNYDRSKASAAHSRTNDQPTLTREADAADTDINVLVRRFGVIGTMPFVSDPPKYADYESVFDFQTAMNTVRQAEEAFNSLDAQLRKRFSNDPQEFLAFCSNSDNLPEMEKLGIVKPQPKPADPPSPSSSGST